MRRTRSHDEKLSEPGKRVGRPLVPLKRRPAHPFSDRRRSAPEVTNVHHTQDKRTRRSDKLYIVDGPCAGEYQTQVAVKKPLFEIKVRGVTCQALLDSGASASLIDQEWFKNLNPGHGFKIRPVRMSLRQASGNAKIEGAVRLVVHSELGPTRHRFLIVPNLAYNVIVGRDFLAKMDLVLHSKVGGWSTTTKPEITPYANPNKSNTDQQGLNTDLNHQQRLETQVNSIKGDPIALKALSRTLQEFHYLFSEKPGCTNLVEHVIDTQGNKPIKMHPRPMSHRKRQLFDTAFQELLDNDLIEESNSPWASPPVLVEREGKSPRLCLDTRKLNNITTADSYPMPSIPNILAYLGGSTVFTVLDLSRGYFQIPLAANAKPKTAFTSHRGLWQFKRMPFGLINSPATFMRFVDTILGNSKWNYCIPYLDDLIIFSKSLEEHVVHVRKVLAKLASAGVTINPKKVQLCQEKIKLLGFEISPGKCKPDSGKVKALHEYPSPRDTTELQRFLGLIAYYRTFIPNASGIAAPLYHLLKKDVKWCWSTECETAMRKLISELSNSAENTLPDLNKPFVIQCDASGSAIAAVLLQDVNSVLQPISFISRVLTSPERKYSTTEKEGLAVIYALRQFRMYIEMTPFKIMSDHRPLSFLKTLKQPEGRLARWAMEVASYDCDIQYIPGNQNKAADALSRTPPPSPLPAAEPPSGSCHVVEARPLEDGFTGAQIGRDQFIKAQRGDEQLTKLRAMLEGRSLVLQEQNEDHSDKYVIQDDGLIVGYFPSDSKSKNDLEGEKVWKILVPDSLKCDVLTHCHDNPISGHLGVFKTYNRLKNNFTWSGMLKDCKVYVKSCITCQEVRPANRRPPGLLQSSTVHAPFEAWAVDLMGPFPRSINGAQYLLVMVDTFTKWTECVPLRKLSSEKIWEYLRTTFCRFGFPRILISDNATIFKSKFHKRMCATLNIQDRHITRYHSQSNICERTNRDLRQMLKKYTDKHKDWDKFIPELSFAIRTAKSEASDFSPAFLTFARELRCPLDNLTLEQTASPGNTADFAAKMAARLQSAQELARQNVAKTRARQEQIYNKKHSDIEFQTGDSVLLQNFVLSDASKGITSTLAKRRLGPYLILKKLSPINYLVGKTKDSKKTILAHISQLSRYYERPAPWRRPKRSLPTSPGNGSKTEPRAPPRYNLRPRRNR